MLALIGLAIVICSVAGGYAMAHGPFYVLWQPAEFVTIGGAALGGMITGMPKTHFKLLKAGLKDAITGGTAEKEQVLELLQMLYELLGAIRKNGLLFLEKELKDPHQSEFFNKYPYLLHNHHALDFLVDGLSFWVGNNAQPDDLDAYLDNALGTHEEEATLASGTVTKVADALPGLGIVAAVLGIIITMQSLDQPPEVLGHHVGAALVGTFVGVLAAYGFCSPIATIMENQSKESERYMLAIKMTIVAFADGQAPATAVEIGRVQFFTTNRPGGEEMMTFLRGQS